jgi:cell division septum initiation protein DivIVA
MEKLSKDTVKKKTATFLTDAYEQSGNISNLLNNKKYLERAMKESGQRISDLKHDLNENLIEKNKSAEYIVHELNASGKICDVVNKAIERAKTSSAKLDSMKTRIIFIADSLKLR